MINESLKFTGSLTAVLTKPDGTSHVIHKHNIILNAGFDFICDAMCKSSGRPNSMTYIAVGTNNTAPAVAQTALSAQLKAKTATYAHTAGTKIFTLTTTFNPNEATGAIVEACVKNADSGGILLDRVTFPVIHKEAADTLKVTFTFTLS